MKKLFNLKKTQWHDILYLSGEHAEIAYRTSRLPKSTYSKFFCMPRWVPDGYYDKCLTFEEWLKLYRVRIL